MNENPRRYRRKAQSSTTDAGLAENNSYNDQAGVRKVSDFGKSLKPLQIGATSYTTDYTTARNIGLGRSLAIYNNSAAVKSITFSDTAITALAAGATDASGNVGIPLPPNAWTYLSNYNKQFAITDSALAIVLIADDDTDIQLV